MGHLFDTHEGSLRATAQHGQLIHRLHLTHLLCGRIVKKNQTVHREDGHIALVDKAPSHRRHLNPVPASGETCHPARRYRQIQRECLGKAAITLRSSLDGKHEFLTPASKNFYTPCKPYTLPESYASASHVGVREHKVPSFTILVTNSTNALCNISYRAYNLPSLNAVQACDYPHNVSPNYRWSLILAGHDIINPDVSISGWAVARSPRLHNEAEE